MPDSPVPRAARARPQDPSRRALLALGLGGAAAALAGCTDTEPAPGTRRPARPAGLTPDVSVATQALAEIQAVREAVSATLRRYPDARGTLGPLVPMHRAHEETLVDAVPERARPSARPAAYRVPRRRRKALADLARREQRLHTTLDALAVKAQSGQFARLLAGMGAAIHQRLATWSA